MLKKICMGIAYATIYCGILMGIWDIAQNFYLPLVLIWCGGLMGLIVAAFLG